MKIKKLLTLVLMSSLLFLVSCGISGKKDERLDGTWKCSSAHLDNSQIKEGDLTYSFGNVDLKDNMPDIKIQNGHIEIGSKGQKMKYKYSETSGNYEIYTYSKNLEKKFAYDTTTNSIILTELFEGTLNNKPYSSYVIMTYVKK